MILSLNNIGKRYNYEWIFKHLTTRLESGHRYAVLGPNGSGKSTLLQLIAGSLSFSEGAISYSLDQQQVKHEDIYQYFSISAPYLDLIEEFTLKELFQFHEKFKPFIKGFSFKEMAERVQLGEAFEKEIRYYSSGMKQRAKLAQAFFSDTPLLLLDEPCTNLDAKGVALYKSLLEAYTREKLVIISSNVPLEYEGCDKSINIIDYK